MRTVSPKIYVAGHRGMVGSAIVRQLLAQGHTAERIITRIHDVAADLANAKKHALLKQHRYQLP